MKKVLAVSLFAAVLSGCCSVTEIGRFKGEVKTDDGETPVASVSVFNISYSLFGVLPFESGTTWKGAPGETRNGWNAAWFTDNCTTDENIASLRAALREIGSDRVANLVTDTDSWMFWSLYILRRRVVKTTCVVLK